MRCDSPEDDVAYWLQVHSEDDDRTEYGPCTSCGGEGGRWEWRWNSRWAIDPGYEVRIDCEDCSGTGSEELTAAGVRSDCDMDDEDDIGYLDSLTPRPAIEYHPTP